MFLNFLEVLLGFLVDTLVVVLGSNSVDWLKEVSIDLLILGLLEVLLPLELGVVLLDSLSENLFLLDWLVDTILASSLEDTIFGILNVLTLEF
jgi:hypothetical protein